MEIPIAEVVKELVAFLGLTTVAALAAVKETRIVQRWIDGTQPQSEHVLRFALQLVSMVAPAGGPGLARAWFHGSNPALGDQTPIALFRSRPFDEVRPLLLNAARVFAGRDGQPAEKTG
jgi:hypothetical protein